MKSVIHTSAAVFALASSALWFAPASAQSTGLTAKTWARQCSPLSVNNYGECCPGEGRVRLFGSDAGAMCDRMEDELRREVRRTAVQPDLVLAPIPDQPVAQPDLPAGQPIIVPVANPPVVNPPIANPPIAGAPVPAAPDLGGPVGTPTPDAEPTAPSDDLGNPGNDKDVGRAGESPNGSDFGDGVKGKSDVGGKGGSGGSKGGSKGGSGGGSDTDAGGSKGKGSKGGSNGNGNAGGNGKGNSGGNSKGSSGGNGKGRN